MSTGPLHSGVGVWASFPAPIFRPSLGRDGKGVSRWINTDVEMPDFCSQPSTPARGSVLAFAAGTTWGGGSEGEGADEPHRRASASLLPGSALSPSSIRVSLAVAPALPQVLAPAFSHPRRSGSGRARLESATAVSGGAHSRSFRLPRGSAFCLVVSINTGGW